jgi:hypothetical protein
MNTEQPRIEYVEARRALLDALTALRSHANAFILIGAQAVYLRTAGRLPGYQPYTTDADLALDPSRLDGLHAGPARRTSTVSVSAVLGLFDCGVVDLVHGHHRVEDALGDGGVRVGHCFAQYSRGDLP